MANIDRFVINSFEGCFCRCSHRYLERVATYTTCSRVGRGLVCTAVDVMRVLRVILVVGVCMDCGYEAVLSWVRWSRQLSAIWRPPPTWHELVPGIG